MWLKVMKHNILRWFRHIEGMGDNEIRKIYKHEDDDVLEGERQTMKWGNKVSQYL